MNSVFVVEGIHDEMRIKSIYPSAQVVITNGREVSQQTIEMIQELSRTNDIIIFTDPDYPGEKIRELIATAVPTAKHAFLRKKDAISKNHKKVGIEHASRKCIEESLATVYTPIQGPDQITMQDLFELGLNGRPESAQLRELVSSKLNMGRPNTKTFLKRLNMFQISKEELMKLCQK